MSDDRRQKEALFRYSVLGPALARRLRKGELRATLDELAEKEWTGPDGRPRKIAAKTLEEWYYRHRAGGFDALVPRARKDRGVTRALTREIRELILDMKREDPGRSVPLILEELADAGRIERESVSETTVQRLFKREGLSGPKLELDRPARYRWSVSRCGELWQADAVHGPALFDPAAGRETRVKIFALIDDKSRLVPYARASFHETQADFLVVFHGAIQRRGAPSGLLVDNHKSFTGTDTGIACAKLGTKLHTARPGDGPGKGKIERFWRTFRGRFLERLDLSKVHTLDALNVRVATWINRYNERPHSSLGGRTPLEVWEEDAEKIRWIDNDALLEAAFTATLERVVKNDSTCEVRGRTYEVPTHLRGRTVRLGYSLVHPESLWVEDGGTRVHVREVDPLVNHGRPRTAKNAGPWPRKTGLNAVEDLLKRVSRGPKRPGKDGRRAP